MVAKTKENELLRTEVQKVKQEAELIEAARLNQ